MTTTTASFFEEDYLVRTLGRIAHDPEVALIELVANAWDAGASLVDLTIPPTHELALTVVDNGHGMNAAQFKGRRMRLAVGERLIVRRAHARIARHTTAARAEAEAAPPDQSVLRWQPRSGQRAHDNVASRPRFGVALNVR